MVIPIYQNAIHNNTKNICIKNKVSIILNTLSIICLDSYVFIRYFTRKSFEDLV